MNNKIIFYAFRYCLGRSTYAVSDMCEYLISVQDDLPEEFKSKVSREIQEHQDNWGKVGMEMDNKEWNYIKWLFDKSRHVNISAKYHNEDRWEEHEAVKGGDGKYYSKQGKGKTYHTVEEI